MTTTQGVPGLTLDDIEHALELGFCLVPIPLGVKVPPATGWQDKPITTVEQARDEVLGKNAGIIHKHSGTITLDVDDLEGAAKALDRVGINLHKLLDAPGPKIKSPRGTKPIFLLPEGVTGKRYAIAWPTLETCNLPKKQQKLETIFELRAGNTQDVLPGSVHPSGAPYEWIDRPESREDIPPMPGSLLTLFQNWGSLKTAMMEAAPGYKPPQPPSSTDQDSATPKGEGNDVIGEFNRRYTLHDVLLQAGCKHEGGNRYLDPNSTTGIAGLVILKGEDGKERVFSHGSSSPLFGEHASDTFGAWVAFEHDGDIKAAVKEAAQEFGMGYSSDANITILKSGDDDGDKRRDRKKVRLVPDLYLQAQSIIQALHELNDPPAIFQRGRELSRIVAAEGKPSIEPFDPDSIRNFIQSRLECTKLVATGEKRADGSRVYEEAPANPSRTVAAYILTSSHWPFPELRGIVYAPHFSAAGELVTDPGYSPASKLYLDLGGFTPRPVPTYPTAAEVSTARDLILNELLPDFPFVDDASKAHAVALGLLPYVRTMIDGPTPLHATDASTPGTGKSLKIEVLTFAATGLLPKIMSEGRDDDEWRKRITSTLLDSPTAVMIDNVNRRLDSGSLSAAITSRVWTDRKLGQTQNVNIPNLACWTVTGNNLTTSKEIARRLLWIRLDAKMERPWERTKFKHPKIMEWVNLNRHAVVHAFLTLAQNWIAKGKPKPDKSLGSFEAWSAVVGGILEAAGIKGFLGNLEALYDRADAESQEWRSFVELWWAAHTNNPVGTAELYALALKNDALLSVLGDKSEASQKIRLGRALASREDRVIGNRTVRRAAVDSHNKVQKYYLTDTPTGDLRVVGSNYPQKTGDLRVVTNVLPAQESATDTGEIELAGSCGECEVVPCVCIEKQEGKNKNIGVSREELPATTRTIQESTASTVETPAGSWEDAPSTTRTTTRKSEQPPAQLPAKDSKGYEL